MSYVKSKHIIIKLLVIYERIQEELITIENIEKKNTILASSLTKGCNQSGMALQSFRIEKASSLIAPSRR